nr:hypothetical protein [Tanacetum cinerariifolium]
METHGRKKFVAETALHARDPRDDNGSEDVNPFGGGNPLLTKETESEPIIWDIEDEEEEYPFVNEYPSFNEEPIMFVKDESCLVYDTDNEEEDGNKDEQTKKLLAMVDQSPNSLMKEAIDQPTKALFNEILLKHSSMGVRASVASCLGKITRITTPYAPYVDGSLVHSLTGVPICIFEIGRFNLVDGNFSPNGTSIVLSDEVGQLYILSIGQGEAQNDAKYDKFFLNDYTPLIQDIHGNVLYLETQLAPYQRNMQDLLCDSGMISYLELLGSKVFKELLLFGYSLEMSSKFSVVNDTNKDYAK